MSVGKEPRDIYLPLEKLDKCSQCDKTINLRLCSSCGERIYCSEYCQKFDWPSHKLACGKTDKIDLASFYPLLACLVEKSHMCGDKPVHPALLHRIVNSPNPGACPMMFELDGWEGMPIILGDRVFFLPGTEDWWPSASSAKVRGKLLRRICREGYVLPIITAICIALLAEMYSTTSGSSVLGSDGKQRRRVRLRYKSSPIADFGIAAGSARVTSQDKLAYIPLADGQVIRGQDPDQHYWIYFTTVRGEEIILDCAMFTFNMCKIVAGAEQYLPQTDTISSFAPAYFGDRSIRLNTPESLHTERRRISVLRNEAFHAAVVHSATGFSKANLKIFCGFIEELSGKSCSQKEEELLTIFALRNCDDIQITLENRVWARFPATPQIGFEQDPGESARFDDSAEAWFRYLKKWKK